MTLAQALVYGVVQGFTEYLPISSTAHLRIVPALLGWRDPGAAFTAIIQLGTLGAVLLYFCNDIISISRATCVGFAHGKPFETFEAKLGWMILAGTIPVVAVGAWFKENIENNLRSLYVVSGAMIGLAILLMAAEWVTRERVARGQKFKEMGDLGWVDAIVVGLAQAVALVPGSSRSGVTITGGLFLGMTRDTAARFSFLLSLPSVFAAGAYELFKHRHEFLGTQDGIIDLLAASITAGAVGYASIAFLLRYLKTHTTYPFIIYRLALGGLILVLLSTGKIQPAQPPAPVPISS